MADIELVIKIPEEKYYYIKKQVAEGIDNPLKEYIANGTPVKTVINAEEAEAYPIINQEENCRIVREFLHDIAEIKDLPVC